MANISIKDYIYGTNTSRVLLKDTWAPSSGNFPTDTTEGIIYVADDAGTVSSQEFVAGDAIMYADGAWQKLGNEVDATNQWVIHDANYTASDGDRILADTSSGAITITMPASPLAGDVVVIAPLRPTYSTNNLTIAGNGENISGSGSDVIISEDNLSVEVEYVDASEGWVIIERGDVGLILTTDSTGQLVAVLNNSNTYEGENIFNGQTTFNGTVIVAGVPQVSTADGNTNSEVVNVEYINLNVPTNLTAVLKTGTNVMTGTYDITGGTINAPTATQGDNSTTVASTAYVDTGLDTKMPLNGTVIVDGTTSRSLSASDNGAIIRFTNAGAITLTIPAGLGAGFNVMIEQGGAGAITPTASGTTIFNFDGHTVTAGQGALIRIVSTVDDNFTFTGDTA